MKAVSYVSYRLFYSLLFYSQSALMSLNRLPVPGQPSFAQLSANRSSLNPFLASQSLVGQSFASPLEVARWMLFSMGIQIRVHHLDRLPQSPFVMIANHRSFLDAPLLMAAAAKPVHFACHHYMAQVPIMRNVVDALGCFPLDEPNQRGLSFFKRASGFLRSQESIGVFPEGTGPMVEPTAPDQVGSFHRGFAHLALRWQSLAAGETPAKNLGAPLSTELTDPLLIEPLKLVPAAIIALEEKHQDTVPFQLLSWFDPSEPLFQQSGLHPAVIYRRVAVVIGEPIEVNDWLQQGYHGRRAGQLATGLSEHCHDTIQALLKAGCY
jgi:1-acyl-sn-glycerol-3-phosphate acyltransferase